MVHPLQNRTGQLRPRRPAEYQETRASHARDRKQTTILSDVRKQSHSPRRGFPNVARRKRTCERLPGLGPAHNGRSGSRRSARANGSFILEGMNTPSSRSSQRFALGMAIAALLTLLGYLWDVQGQGSSLSGWIIAVVAAITVGALGAVWLQPRRLQLGALIPATFAATCLGAVLFTSGGWTMVIAAVLGSAAIRDSYRQRRAAQR